MKIWDISPLVTPTFPLWPGSTSLQRSVVCDMNLGESVTSSDIISTVHLGAHADAPSHYAKEGKAIHTCNLHYYLGPCQVMRPMVGLKQPITQKCLVQKIVAPRVLFATSTFDFSKPFQQDFSAFDPGVFEFLAQQQVITIGIDSPSIDLYEVQDLPCHRLAFQYGIAILENLDLSQVPEGIYELIALPLKIEGFDASPIRAVLRSIS